MTVLLNNTGSSQLIEQSANGFFPSLVHRVLFGGMGLKLCVETAVIKKMAEAI